MPFSIAQGMHCRFFYNGFCMTYCTRCCTNNCISDCTNDCTRFCTAYYTSICTALWLRRGDRFIADRRPPLPVAPAERPVQLVYRLLRRSYRKGLHYSLDKPVAPPVCNG